MPQDKKPKILCVDDERLNLKLLKSILEPEGYEFLGVESGEIALVRVAQDPPDIVLLDVMMLKMNGFEVLQNLRADEKTRFLPIVMITALRETEDRVKALEEGCDDFISKPFDKSELLARVKSLLRIKLLHDEVDNSYKKLEELERLKDSLIHMVVHDLNNPLSVISGGIQLLEVELSGKISPKTKADLDMVVLASQILVTMINNLLDINKMEKNKMDLKYENFNLCDLTKAIIEQMKIAADAEGKTVSLEPVEDMPFISADKELIRRVIVNLINNAFKFTSSGGYIYIKLFYKKENNNFFVQVKDTGTGIAKEYLDMIFDKFFQVETEKSQNRIGTGLGLAFCRLAIGAHGGKIWAESELGKGSTFTFSIPFKPSGGDN